MSINQLALYALILVLGWLLGLLSRSGGAKWRRQYESERTERLTLERAHADREAASRTRIAELERQHAELESRHAAAVATPAAPIAATTVAATSAASAAHAGQRDDLSLIRGIGRSGEAALNDAGIHQFVDLSRLGDADAAVLETRLDAAPGTIAREEWREQAALLASGRFDEHRSRFA